MHGTEYKILNVPYEWIDAEGEEFVDVDVAIKIKIIRELMFTYVRNRSYSLICDIRP